MRLGGVGVGVAVGGVELGGDVGVVAGHRRLLVVAGHRLVDDVVRGRGAHLPARAVEEQLGGGVVVDEELEAHPPESSSSASVSGSEPARARGRSRRGVRRGALVVVAPLGREVAVQVDTVARGDGPVAVVVPQVLAPQPLAGLEGEVVAVGVRDRHEPQLGGLHQPGDPRVLAVPVEERVHEPTHHLGGDPLAGVLGTEVEHRGTLAVLGLACVLGDLEGQDLLPLHGRAVADQLGDPRVLRSRLTQLLLQTTVARVAAGRPRSPPPPVPWPAGRRSVRRPASAAGRDPRRRAVSLGRRSGSPRRGPRPSPRPPGRPC